MLMMSRGISLIAAAFMALALLVAPFDGAASVGQSDIGLFVNADGCEVEFINVEVPNPDAPGQTIIQTRASCKDVSCDGICVLQRFKGDTDHTMTKCYCDWPNVTGEEEEQQN